MPQCDAVVSRLYNQGQSGAIIYWKFVDFDTGQIVDPTSESVKLFDPSDVQRDPSDTSNTTAASTTPTEDTSGSITGNAGWFYITVNFDISAEVGKWYLQITNTHEGATTSNKILCFNVLAAGAGIGGDVPSATPYTYCTPGDVEHLLQSTISFDSTTTPTAGIITMYINQAEGEFDDETGTAFRPVTETDVVLDMEAWRERHNEYFNWDLFNRRPFQLSHRPILPFDTDRGHRVEVYEGTSTVATVSDPVPRWTEWLDGTEGRDNDYWIDHEKGMFFIRKPLVLRTASAVRVTYEWGKPITTITTNVDDTADSIPVVSTYRYQQRGFVRIGDEWIHHTGKTATSFTGCTRGVRESTAASHSDGDEVYEVPDNVWSHVCMRAAALYLENERFSANVPEGGQASRTISMTIDKFNEKWDELLHKRYQRWTLL